ncbi:MAG: ABC transporter permease [Deltaproteobacteria bacterium]|nr:ABC transporter permease [Deltaproteobacteria bacterium]
MMLFLAKRFLGQKNERSVRSQIMLISFLGLLFVSAFVIVALAILSGSQKVYRDAVLNFNAHILIFHQDGLYEHEVKSINAFLLENTQGFHASGYQYHEILVPTKLGLKPVIVKGIELAQKKEVYPLSWQEEKNFSGDGAYLGKELYRSLQARGETFSYINAKEGLSLKQSLRIAGQFESGYFDFDERFVLMDLALLRKTFSKAQQVEGLEIRLNHVEELDVVAEALWQKFGDDFEIQTWKELNHSLFEALKLDRTVVFSVSLLVVMIACLNFFGFLFLFFMERRREFLLLNRLGLSKQGLGRLLVFVGLSVGGASVGLGSVLGLAFVFYLHKVGIALDPTVYFVDRVPVFLEPIWIVAFVSGALLLCWLTAQLAGMVLLKDKKA